MQGDWFSLSEYKLTDLLSSAGATIGVIIAGTIFLQFMSTKHTELFSRYRELTCEYRGRHADEPRHGSLQKQIQLYRRRLRLMNRASALAAVALMCFLLAVLAGGLSLLQPPRRAYKYIGTVGLFSGLALMATAVSMGFAEIILSRHDLGHEIADLDEEVRSAC